MEIHIYTVKRDIYAADASAVDGIFGRESRGWAYNLVMSLFRFPRFLSDTHMRANEDKKKIRRMVRAAVRQYHSGPARRRSSHKCTTVGERLLREAGWRVRHFAV